ncbi:alpha/beta fold hydrolase [Rhodococcus sp. NBC_00297]|uniref:alpha/beta fold hydrolase n=1 Tax=Rhodococcus sp. NBC_00297 TaxID=2976005 RepID=UPI002E2B4504|nr:alpha/beta fold hydrolase [Rhodococcus sp. NBC_00297]
MRIVGERYPTRVLEMGSGDTLLLLHGQGGSLENFRHNIPAYSASYRVVAVDLLWHGLSATPPVDPALIPIWVAQVIEVIESLNLGPCHVEGQSLGGWIATTLSLQRPDLVRSLTLTTPMGLNPTTAPVDPVIFERVLKQQLATLHDLSVDGIRQRIASLFKNPDVIDDEIVQIRQALYSRRETNAALREVATAYFGRPSIEPYRIGPQELATITAPTLLYWGSANIGGPDAGEALAAAIPDAEYHCADVGHWAQYEEYDEHNRVVLDFLQRHSRLDTSSGAGSVR